MVQTKFSDAWLGVELIKGKIMVDKTFAYHKPSAEGMAKLKTVRQGFSDLKRLIEDNAFASRELSLAITNLEQAAMWANKAVVSNDPNSEADLS
jgi:hypothetical protein